MWPKNNINWAPKKNYRKVAVLLLANGVPYSSICFVNRGEFLWFFRSFGRRVAKGIHPLACRRERRPAAPAFGMHAAPAPLPMPGPRGRSLKGVKWPGPFEGTKRRWGWIKRERRRKSGQTISWVQKPRV